MMEHQNDGIVRDIPSVMIGVKNDRFRTCLVQREDQATGRVDPEIFCWSIGFKVVSDQWVYARLRNPLRDNLLFQGKVSSISPRGLGLCDWSRRAARSLSNTQLAVYAGTS
jgi:hypothetical protein